MSLSSELVNQERAELAALWPTVDVDRDFHEHSHLKLLSGAEDPDPAPDRPQRQRVYLSDPQAPVGVAQQGVASTGLHRS